MAPLFNDPYQSYHDICPGNFDFYLQRFCFVPKIYTHQDMKNLRLGTIFAFAWFCIELVVTMILFRYSSKKIRKIMIYD